MIFKKVKDLAMKPVFKFKINYNPAKWSWQKIKEFLKISLLAVGLIAAFMVVYDEVTYSNEQFATDVGDKVINCRPHNSYLPL